MTTTAVSSKRLAFVVFSVAFAVCANTLANGFVWDDIPQVVENPWLRDAKNIPKLFLTWAVGHKGEAGSSYYRPLMNVSYLLTYAAAGLRPWAFHLVNVVVHCAAAVMVLVLLRSILRRRDASKSAGSDSGAVLPALAGAFLFATHPIHTEPVAWIGALPDLLFTLFCLLALYFHLRWTDGASRGFYVLAPVSYLFALFSKEPALGLPIILFAFDSSLGKSRLSWKGLLNYVPYALVTALYLAMRVHALHGLAPWRKHESLSGYEILINVFPLFAAYLQQMILPVGLNAFHVFHPVTSILDPRATLSLAVTVSFVGAGCVAFAKSKEAFFALALICVPLLPVLYFPAVGENALAERYVYLPSVGFVLLVALFLARMGWMTAARPRGITLALLVILALYSWGTVTRNADWKDDVTLWTDTVRKSPDAIVPRVSLANALAERGSLDMAIEQYRAALALRPDSVGAHTNLGLLYLQRGRLNDAFEELNQALAIDPSSPETQNGLGLLYKRIGLIDQAIEHYLKALEGGPGVPGVYYNIASAFELKGMRERAEDFRRRGRNLEAQLR